MKKSLLKASLICLGITLLCGLSSFNTPNGVKSQGRNASIVYDTIITPFGEGSQCMKEVVEGDNRGCTCSLFVETFDNNSWILWLEVTGNNGREVKVEGDYYIVSYDGRDNHQINRVISGNEKQKLRSGSSNSVCIVTSLEPCFLR